MVLASGYINKTATNQYILTSYPYFTESQTKKTWKIKVGKLTYTLLCKAKRVTEKVNYCPQEEGWKESKTIIYWNIPK